MPVRSRYYGWAQKFGLEGFYTQFLAQTKFCLRACRINKNKPIVFRYNIFPQTLRLDSHYLIEATVQGIGQSLSCYSCLMLRSLFPTNDNSNSEYSNQLYET